MMVNAVIIIFSFAAIVLSGLSIYINYCNLKTIQKITSLELESLQIAKRSKAKLRVVK